MQTHTWKTLIVGVCCACGALSGTPGRVAADDIGELRQQLAEQRRVMELMEQRLLELEGKEQTRSEKEIEYGYSQPEALRRDGLEAGDVYDGGFYVRSKDNSYSLNVNGFVQSRYTFLAPEQGRSRNNFDVALARLAFSGTVFDPKVSYFFQFEGTTFGNSNRQTMLDWWMQYSFSDYAKVQAGRFILPYSRQFYTHPGNLLFSDLSEADYAFNLQRAVGANLSGSLGKLSYHAVVTNSIRALDAGGQQNVGAEVAWQGRLEYDLLEPYGYLESSPTPAAAPQLSLGVAAAFNPVDDASGFQNVRPGDRTTNVTVDGGFRYLGLSVQAAGYYRRNNFQNADQIGHEIGHDWGYYGQIGYYLTERLELAGRVSGVDFHFDNNVSRSNPRTRGDVREYTAGLNYYLYGHAVKLQLDYSFLDGDPFDPTRTSTGDNRFRIQTQILF